jgi:HTH-type transcriptional regulator / antitoxin HigA
MIDFMNELLDEVGENRSHALAGLLDVVAGFIRDYEDEHVEDPKPPPGEVLRFLMGQHGMGLLDLADLFESADSLANATTGTGSVGPREARALGKRFGVPAAMFL